MNMLSAVEFRDVLRRSEIQGLAPQGVRDDVSYRLDLTALKQWMQTNHYMRPGETTAEGAEDDAAVEDDCE